jgi:hypothetical protein
MALGVVMPSGLVQPRIKLGIVVACCDSLMLAFLLLLMLLDLLINLRADEINWIRIGINSRGD